MSAVHFVKGKFVQVAESQLKDKGFFGIWGMLRKAAADLAKGNGDEFIRRTGAAVDQPMSRLAQFTEAIRLWLHEKLGARFAGLRLDIVDRLGNVIKAAREAVESTLSGAARTQADDVGGVLLERANQLRGPKTVFIDLSGMKPVDKKLLHKYLRQFVDHGAAPGKQTATQGIRHMTQNGDYFVFHPNQALDLADRARLADLLEKVGKQRVSIAESILSPDDLLKVRAVKETVQEATQQGTRALTDGATQTTRLALPAPAVVVKEEAADAGQGLLHTVTRRPGNRPHKRYQGVGPKFSHREAAELERLERQLEKGKPLTDYQRKRVTVLRTKRTKSINAQAKVQEAQHLGGTAAGAPESPFRQVAGQAEGTPAA